VGISMFLWEYKLSPWVGFQFKLGTSASYHWQYVEPCTVAMVGTTTVQRQRWKAYYGITPYHWQRRSFKTAVGAGKGLATILWKIHSCGFQTTWCGGDYSRMSGVML